MNRHYEFPHVVEVVRQDSGHLQAGDRSDTEERRPSVQRVDVSAPRPVAASA